MTPDARDPPDYPGAAFLETMREARNYNAWLGALVRGELGDSALDFGAGAGTFADALREDGVRVACVEPDPALAAALRRRGHAVHADIGELEPGTLPAVYTLNVLEHIEDDLAALRAIRRALAPGGRLIVYVPAFPILFSGFDRLVGHRRRYRGPALAALVERAGLRVVAWRYRDSLGFVVALLFRPFARRPAAPAPWLVRLYDRALFPLSVVADRLLGRVVGKNVWLVAVRD